MFTLVRPDKLCDLSLFFTLRPDLVVSFAAPELPPDVVTRAHASTWTNDGGVWKIVEVDPTMAGRAGE